MDQSPSTISSGILGRERSWPKFSLLISVFLWLLAWEAIVWCVPVQPRMVIRTDESLTGFSPDGKMLVTSVGERDPALPGTIFHLWDIRTGQDLGTLGSEEKNILPNVVYSAQRNLLDEIISPFNASDDYILCNLAGRQETRHIQINRDPNAITDVCFSNDGRTLACCTNTNDKGDLNMNDKGNLKLIDVATGQVRAHLHGGPFGTWAGFVFSQDGSTLATTETKPNQEGNIGDDIIVIVLDTRTGKKKMVLQDCGPTIFLSLSPDGTKLAMKCLNESLVRVWDLKTGSQSAHFKARGSHPEFLPDGKELTLFGEDFVIFCDATTGKELAVTHIFPCWLIGGPQSPLIPIPDTNLLAVSANHVSKPNPVFKWFATFLGNKALGEDWADYEIGLLDTKTGERVASIVQGRINGVQVFPDGRTLALETSKNHNSIIEIWDIPPQKPLRWVLALLAIPSAMTLITFWKLWKARRQSVG